METVQTDFGDLVPAADEGNWVTQLDIDKSGKVANSLDNLVLIIRNDPKLQSIAFNRHRDGIDTKGELPWEQIKDGWNDSDYAALKVYLSQKYGLYSPSRTKDALVAVASERAYHPIKDYLDGLPAWDGVSRVDHLLVDYFGAEDNLYTPGGDPQDADSGGCPHLQTRDEI